MKAANTDPIHFGWLDRGRTAPKSQCHVVPRSQTQWHRALLLTQLTAGIQDKSIVLVLWLTSFLVLSYGFPMSFWPWQELKGIPPCDPNPPPQVSLAHPGCFLNQSNRLQERWGNCQMKSNPMVKSTSILANWSLIPNTELYVHSSSGIVFCLERENWKQETWVPPLP